MVADGAVAFVRVLGVRDKATNAPATERTLYRIGSVSKTFTAATVLALRDAGLLALDAPAESYLPELAEVRYPFADAPRITLRHLLTHTSGLPRLGDFDYTRSDRDVTESEVLGALARTELERAPGVEYVYSNFGVSLLGPLIARRAPQRSYRAAVAALVTEPLGLRHTTFDPASVSDAEVATGYAKRDATSPAPLWRLGASEAAGGMWSTAADMARWIAAQLAAWPPRNEPERGPLRRASLRESHAPAFSVGLRASVEGERIDARSASVGLAWHGETTCDYERLIRHTGAVDGFSASVSFAPDRDFGFVILSNAIDTEKQELEGALLDMVAPVLRPREAVPAPAASYAVNQLAATLGTCDQATYERLFAPSFRAALPWPSYENVCVSLSTLHGTCRFGRVLALDGPLNGQFELACDRGALLLDAHVQGRGTEGSFVGVLVRSTGFPIPKDTLRAARAALALSARWDDETAKRLFARQELAALVKAQLPELRRAHGACRLPHGIETQALGTGKLGAVLPVDCDRGEPSELQLELDEHGKIAVLAFHRARTEKSRCAQPRAR